MDIEQAVRQITFPAEPKGLYEPIIYALASGGKRLRPMLAVEASRLFGGRDEEVLPAALALEVFHNFTLLHDDVMDHAAMRRGRPTVHARWGTNTAILSGDEMLIQAYTLLAQLPEERVAGALRMFNEMATLVCEGQQTDADFEQREATLDEYMGMIYRKTAVLIAYALKIGAYTAGADEAAQDALFDYGTNLGIAFQIQDDWLDVYGDEKTFGKAIGGDITEGKKTYMYLTALLRADEDDRRTLLRTDWPDQAAKIAAVTDLYTRLGVKETGLEAIGRYTQASVQALERLPQNEHTDRLADLAHRMNRRKY